MKNLVLLIVVFFTSEVLAEKLIWTSELGGANNNGAVVGYDLNTNSLEVVASLGGTYLSGHAYYDAVENSNGFYNTGGLLKASDGYYYGINEFSNYEVSNGKGVLYRIDSASMEVELVHPFTYNSIRTDGNNDIYKSFGYEFSYPTLGLIEENGVIYGIAAYGGVHGNGGIWKYDINSSTYSKVLDFGDAVNDTVSFPTSPLIKGDGNFLYGIAYDKGAVSGGFIYRINTTDDSYEYLADLDVAGWAITKPSSQITYNSSLNIIYGTKELFAGSNYGGGVYSYNINTGVVNNETTIAIGEVDILGNNAYGISPQANDGAFYVVTKNGGANGHGTLIKYQPGNPATMTKVHDFNTLHASGTGIEVVGSKIYGSYFYPQDTNPMLWSYDVSTQQFTNLITSDVGSIGKTISHSFIVDNDKIIARVVDGGSSDVGGLIEYNISSGVTDMFYDHTSDEGRGLVGEMLLVNDSTALAYTKAGGYNEYPGEDSEQGGVVKIDLYSGVAKYDTTLSRAFYKVRSSKNNFNLRMTQTANDNYFVPYYHNVIFSAIFNFEKIDNTSGTVNSISELVTTAEKISSALEYKPNKLIVAHLDTIYLYDDSDESVVSHFWGLTNAEGVMVNNLTMASNGKVYGMTNSYLYTDDANKAVIYSIDTSTWTATVEHTFETDVKEANIGLTEYNGKLFGSTISGGTNDEGYIFSYDIVSKTFVIEHSLASSVEGAGFFGQWTLHDSLLYAVSYVGGANNFGTLASFNPATSTFTVLEDLTLETGLANKASISVWNDQDTIVSINSPTIDSEYGLQMNIWENTLYIKSANAKKVEFYNFAGQIVKTSSYSSQIDFSDLESGVYMARVFTANESQTIKVIRK